MTHLKKNHFIVSSTVLDWLYYDKQSLNSKSPLRHCAWAIRHETLIKFIIIIIIIIPKTDSVVSSSSYWFSSRGTLSTPSTVGFAWAGMALIKEI